MEIKDFYTKNIWRVTAIFVVLISFSILPSKTANAQTTGVSCIASTYISNWIKGLFTKKSVSEVNTSDNQTHSKEFTLDRLASCAAKQMLHEMTAATVQWINNDFKGRPAFMTDPEGFFLDAADQATGQFISKNGPLAKLCSPWSVDIKLALLIEQAETNFDGVRRNKYACTLGTILRNAKNTSVNVDVNVRTTDEDIDNFVRKGDFSVGGWKGFMELISVAGSNPFTTFLEANSDSKLVKNERRAGIQYDLSYGLGFLSQEFCEDLPAIGIEEYGDDPTIRVKADGGIERCTKKTPGSVIANSLQKQLNVPATELELADNINAVVNALVNQMVNKVMTSGLTSLSAGGSGVRYGRNGLAATYASQLASDARGTSQTTTATSDPRLTQIKDTYDQALRFLTEGNQSLQLAKSCLVEAVEVGIVTSSGVNQPPQTRTLNDTQAAEAQAMISEIDTFSAEQVDPLMNQIINNKIAVINLPSPTPSELDREQFTANQLYSTAEQRGALITQTAEPYQTYCDAL